MRCKRCGERPSALSLPYYNTAFIGDSDPVEIDGNQKCADCNGWTERLGSRRVAAEHGSRNARTGQIMEVIGRSGAKREDPDRGGGQKTQAGGARQIAFPNRKNPKKSEGGFLDEL